MRRVVALVLALLALAQPCSALSPGQELGAGLPPFGGAKIIYANTTTGAVPPWLAHSWGATPTSPPYYFDASGNLQTAPNNLVRNSTMQGASAGSPGTFPSNWSAGVNNGLSYSIVAVGTDSATGLPYIRFNVFGTTSAAAALFSINTETVSAIAASAGMTFISSAYARLVANTGAAPTYADIYAVEYASGVPTGNSTGTSLASWTGVASRFFATRTVTGGTTTSIEQNFYFQWAISGTVVNITFDIVAPQLEQVTAAQTTPRPFMPTTGSAYYGPVVNDYNPSTLAALGLRSEPLRTNLFLANLAPATQTIAVASGTTYTMSFYGTGSIVLSGAATQTMAGAAGVRTQYSFTAGSTSLTATVSGLSATSYAQTEANPFATSPILTYGAAVPVPADNWSFTGAARAQLLSGRACLAVQAQAEGSGAFNPRLWGLDDGTSNNTINAYFPTGNMTTPVELMITGGVTQTGPAIAAGGDITAAPRTTVAAWSPGVYSGSYDGEATMTSSVAVPTGMTNALLGNIIYAPRPWYGWFRQIMIRPSCTAAQVKRYSTAGANLQAANDNEWPMFAANDNLPLAIKIASGGW